MTEEQKNEHINLYYEALKNLRTALPRFSIFLFLLVFLWIIYPFLINLGENIFLEIFENKVELKNLINIIIITYLAVLVLFTYKEIMLVGSAFSKLIVFYSSSPEDDIAKIEIRIKKFENILNLIFAVLISFIIYYIFKDFLIKVNQTLAAVILILLVLSLLLLFLVLSLSLSSEIEIKLLSPFKQKQKKNGNNKKGS